MGDKGNACRVLVGKAEGKRLLERPRRRWENNFSSFKMDLTSNGMERFGVVDWIGASGGILCVW
jgi:hypothetical protein